jgi:hypothetical protein
MFIPQGRVEFLRTFEMLNKFIALYRQFLWRVVFQTEDILWFCIFQFCFDWCKCCLQMNVGFKLLVCPNIIEAFGNLHSPAMKHIYTMNLLYMSHVSILICKVYVRVINFADWCISINNGNKLRKYSSYKTSVMRYLECSKKVQKKSTNTTAVHCAAITIFTLPRQDTN